MGVDPSDLTVEHFPTFFQAVNAPEGGGLGPEPFPWQTRLVTQVAGSGRWPGLLDLPTGTGKTAVLDIAVFLQALRPDVPRRIVFVVDRRVIVQQAFARARRLANDLAQPSGQHEVVAAVAQRLRERAAPPGEDRRPWPPLQCAELRGGIVRDETWAMRPDVPAILVSTVDQVGSRLLFRGYGVSPGMRPVHAGLVGNDVLFLLDEVHLSQPFARTLWSLGSRYRPPRGSRLPERWQVVQMSATPGILRAEAGEDEDEPFRLAPEDRDPQRAPVLHRRLSASKPTRTELVKVRARDEPGARRALTAAMGRVAKGLLENEPHVRTLGVVANRVETAVAVHRSLREDGIPAVLLTGRMRPFDRDDILRGYEARLSTGRVRSPGDEPLAVVSTQAIEAGADFDLDGLVTECASLDALRQRFGRVDRDGVLADARTPAPGVILATAPQVAADADDPIYGKALARTWRWLEARHVDFGHGQMRLPPPDEMEELGLLAPTLEAPAMLPSYLDAWVQTRPRPSTDPDVALWLHGVGGTPARDVNIVWRADFTEDLLAGGGHPPGAAAAAVAELLGACPPTSGEAMAVPLAAVRRWLRVRPSGSGAGDGPDASTVADVEGGESGDVAGELADLSDARPVVVWRGAENDDEQVPVVGDARRLRPGDTIVVPASYGGMSHGNWDPSARAMVDDLGLRGQVVHRRRAVLRIPAEGRTPPGNGAEGQLDGHAAVRHPLLTALPPAPDVVEVRDVDDGDPRRAVEAWIEAAAHAADQLDPHVQLVVGHLRGGSRWDVQTVATGPGDTDVVFVVTGRRPLPRMSDAGDRNLPAMAETVDSEPGTSSLTGVEAPLDRHLVDVERWARGLAKACGLDDELAADLALAGRLHDLGKCDPRFQRYLRAGRLRSPGDEVLAKSGELQPGSVTDRHARLVSGYPRAARHELLSQALVEGDERLCARAHDWDLVLHLVASHHGYARPFAPVAPDPAPLVATHAIEGRVLAAPTDHGLARLDSGITARFWRLVRRYGWHGLAWLEAILRLADHRASAEAQSAPSGQSAQALPERADGRAPAGGRSAPARELVPGPTDGAEQGAALSVHRGLDPKQARIGADRTGTGGDDLCLPALEATNPLGFLAALGVLVELDRAGRQPTLRWSDDLVPQAIVTGPRSPDDVVEVIGAGREAWRRSLVLAWPPDRPLDDTKPAPDDLSRWTRGIEGTVVDARAVADLWSALVAEGALDENGKAKPTHLHFTAGQQRFLAMARELAEGVDVARLREAVVGPWRYDSTLPSFGWDARGERIYALRGTNPAKEKRRGVPGADWLAWIGLSCYLVVNRRGRLETTACARDWRRSAFRWPVWTVPIDLSTVRSLVADPDLVANPGRRISPSVLQARGISRLLESPIRRTDQGGYGSFGAPTTLAEAPPTRPNAGSAPQTRTP